MQTIGITVTWIVRRPFEVSHYAAKEDLGGQLTVVTCPVWLTVTRTVLHHFQYAHV